MKKRTGKTKPFFLNEENMAVATDLYQLTMAAGYFECNNNRKATFELFVRNLPENRPYLLAAGLEQVIYYLKNFKFSPQHLEYLKGLPIFKKVSKEFFSYLQNIRFSGDVFAMPEGTVFFANEPIFRVTAPIIEAQIVETYALSMLNFQTLIASKAARVVYAAKGRDVVDFGTRRAHGPNAGMLASRASFIGGCVGTSNVLAAYELGIPAIGTIAHSWVMSYNNEYKSYKDFHKIFPDNTILLVDTYNTIKGIQLATKIGKKLKGIRLDSGDIVSLSKKARKILDDAGLRHTKIIASGDLNEHKISGLLAKGAPINSFGVGTEMVTSKDAPALGCVYKLVEQEESDGKFTPKMKYSTDKATYPARKQVFRIYNNSGTLKRDIIGLPDEDFDAAPLLIPVIKKGRVVHTAPPIQEIRNMARENISGLPDKFKKLDCKASYPVTISKRLKRVRDGIIP